MGRPLRAGIYVPLPTFFDNNEELDLKSFAKHVVCKLMLSSDTDEVDTASRGILPVVCGTMGEAVHLTHDERVLLVQTARKALDDAQLQEVPILAGIGAASTRESIVLAKK